VLHRLLYADFGSDGVLEGVRTETEGGVSGQYIVEELSALFQFQVVTLIQSSLIYGAASFTFLGLSISTAHEHVQGNHIMNCKLLILNLLIEGLLVDDHFISID